MNINSRIWENSIADLPKGDQQAEQFEHYAREFFIPDSIAPATYLANVAALIQQSDEGTPGVEPTPSATRLARLTERPEGFPVWFLAAYPDVALWFSSREGAERTSLDAEVTRRSAAEGASISHMMDEQGSFGHAVLRTIVDLYREQTGLELESAASGADLQEEGAAGAEAEQALTAQQAVDLMAASITRYERELATSYGDRFPDLQPRLTAAGLLQLGYYVLVDHAIPIAALIHAAEVSVLAEDPVVEFVERLDVEVFCAEGGKTADRKKIEEACHLLRSRILDVVLQTRADFEQAPSLAQATRNFMEEPDFEPLRQAIGILPPA